jgi:Ankyrin repeat
MTFSLMPREINGLIVNYISPSPITNKEIKRCGRTIVNLSLTNSELKHICEEKLKDLKKIHELFNKYSYHNRNTFFIPESGQEIVIGGNSQLFDALLSGHKDTFIGSSFKVYNAEIEEDIKKIVELIPQSINSVSEHANTSYLTPLYAACANENVPVSIIEFLLESGANPNTLFTGNGDFLEIIEDLKFIISPERYEIILALLKEYSLESI